MKSASTWDQIITLETHWLDIGKNSLFSALPHGPCSESPRKTGPAAVLEPPGGMAGEGKEFTAKVESAQPSQERSEPGKALEGAQGSSLLCCVTWSQLPSFSVPQFPPL